MAKIIGNVTITVDSSGATADDPIILSQICAGSNGWGTISGDTKLIFTGNGSAVVFQEDSLLFGSSSGDRLNSVGKIEKNDVSVVGNRILSFTGFNGTLGCDKIEAFSHIELKSKDSVDSEVNLSSAAIDLSGLENWEIECGSSLSGNFTNDFAGDTLNLIDFSGLAADTPVTLMTDNTKSDAKDVFRGFAGLSIKMDGDLVTSKRYDSENRVFAFSSNDVNYTLAIVEPSGLSSSSMVLTRLA